MPFRKAIKGLWDDNPSSPFWEVVKARWRVLCGNAEATLARANAGAPFVRHEYRAADELLKLNRNVPFQDVACTALAMYHLRADQPQRFRSDEAFNAQLVRKVRALDDLAVYSRWNPKTMATHRVYRCLTPRTARVLAGYLIEAFGLAALLLRDHPRSRPEPREVIEARAMADAVKAMQ